MTDTRSVARRLRAVLLPVAAGLAAYAVVAQWSDIRHALDRVGFVAPLLAFLLALVGLAAGALAWRALLTDVGVRLPLAATTRVFFVGQLGKYLPGGVWPVVAQMELGHDAGAERRHVGAVSVLVMAVNVVTGLVVAAACLPFTSSSALHRVGWLLVLVPVGVALLHPRVLNEVIGRALRLLRREPLEQPPSIRGVAAAVAWSLVMWAAFGAHLYVLADPLAESGHRLPLLAVGGYALAWVVGFLVVVAPSGVGVREAMLVLALAPALPAGEATAVALLSRALMTVADLAWAALALLPHLRGRAR
ncbi:MAG: glycosyltransferase 2 family protein [Frankiales bacterium]|nr:glycosyltransferase 2 family protein [Frankiales bacterium]